MDDEIPPKMSNRNHPLGTPPFEFFQEGSWYAADRLSIKGGILSIHFRGKGNEYHKVDRVPHDNMRVRSRRCTPDDCRFLKLGIDVCACMREQQSILWRDAKIVTVEKSPHFLDNCFCKFGVLFYESAAGASRKKLLAKKPPEVFCLANIAILQSLIPEKEGGIVQWRSTRDSFSCGRSKLLRKSHTGRNRLRVGTFAENIAWLVVLSIKNRIEFAVRAVNGSVVFEIIAGRSRPSGSTRQVKLIKFQREDGRPMRLIADRLTVSDSERTAPDARSPESFPPENGTDKSLDEEIGLRRSKRIKVSPDRYCSYIAQNLDEHSKKKRKRLEDARSNCVSSTMKENPFRGSNETVGTCRRCAPFPCVPPGFEHIAPQCLKWKVELAGTNVKVEVSEEWNATENNSLSVTSLARSSRESDMRDPACGTKTRSSPRLREHPEKHASQLKCSRKRTIQETGTEMSKPDVWEKAGTSLAYSRTVKEENEELWKPEVILKPDPALKSNAPGTPQLRPRRRFR